MHTTPEPSVDQSWTPETSNGFLAPGDSHGSPRLDRRRRPRIRRPQQLGVTVKTLTAVLLLLTAGCVHHHHQHDDAATKMHRSIEAAIKARTDAVGETLETSLTAKVDF